ncbi:MAG: rane protein-like protein, partial [Actinomycetia bacterium]|nr:rane protein-like protein [Actinomycetes bacterium]
MYRRAVPSTRLRRIDPLLVSTAALAAIVRFVGLGSQSLWYDEVVTTQVIGGGFRTLLGRIRQKEGTPPIYFIAAAVWSRLFGHGDGAVRSLSALAGTLTVVVVYAVARALGQSLRVARIAALLAAVNPFLVWYSQEARAYALFTLFAALSLLFFARSLRDARTLDLAGFGVVSAATLATHYFAIFLIAPEVAALAAAHWRRWKALLIGVLPIVVAAVPLLLLASDQQSTNQQQWIKAWPLSYRIKSAGRHLLVGPSAPRPWLWVPALGVVLLAVVLLFVAGQRAERRAALAMAAVALGAAGLPAVLAAVTSDDYFIDRNVIVALLPSILVVAIGLGACGARGARWVGVGAATGGVILSLGIVVSVARDPDLE